MDSHGNSTVLISSSTRLNNIHLRQCRVAKFRQWADAKYLKFKSGKRFSIFRLMRTAGFRHYSLSAVDRLEIQLRRREHNKLGFALQLCLMRYPGRVLAVGEIPPRTMLKYVADQIGVDPTTFNSMHAEKRRAATTLPT